jgi:hypothetical protein
MGGPFVQLLASKLYTSPVVALSAGALPAVDSLDMEINPAYRHTFAALEFYSDEGITPVIPASGDITYTLESWVLPGTFLAFQENLTDASIPEQVSWATNATRVRVLLSVVVGATHVRLRVCGNIS